MTSLTTTAALLPFIPAALAPISHLGIVSPIDAASAYLEKTEAAGTSVQKVVSIVDVVKETHRALKENRDEAYAIPDDRALVSHELLRFENSGCLDIKDLVTSDS